MPELPHLLLLFEISNYLSKETYVVMKKIKAYKLPNYQKSTEEISKQWKVIPTLVFPLDTLFVLPLKDLRIFLSKTLNIYKVTLAYISIHMQAW